TGTGTRRGAGGGAGAAWCNSCKPASKALARMTKPAMRTAFIGCTGVRDADEGDGRAGSAVVPEGAPVGWWVVWVAACTRYTAAKRVPGSPPGRRRGATAEVECFS